MSNGIVEKIVAELSDKTKEVDDALIMDVVGVEPFVDRTMVSAKPKKKPA